jgi:hypothetical protein
MAAAAAMGGVRRVRAWSLFDVAVEDERAPRMPTGDVIKRGQLEKRAMSQGSSGKRQGFT